MPIAGGNQPNATLCCADAAIGHHMKSVATVTTDEHQALKGFAWR